MAKIILLSIFVFLLQLNLKGQSDLKLWYNQPARNWNEALPLGNGRLGVMVFGGVEEELLQLNEETLWSGGPANTNPNPHAPALLPQIRDALFKEDYEAAENLTKQLQGLFTESYEPLGDLTIRQKFASTDAPVSGYTRELNISNATALTRFVKNNVTYTREIFVSAPDQVVTIRFTASEKNALDLSLLLSSPLYSSKGKDGSDVILMKGKAPSHTDPSYQQSGELPVVYNDPQQCRGMRFMVKLKGVSSDGVVKNDGNVLQITGGTEAIVFLSAATSFNGFDKCPDKEGKNEVEVATSHLDQAGKRSFADIRSSHIADYKRYFDRVSLSLGSAPNELPTDERLRRYAEGENDHGLEILYYQYGRYLLISSSRPGGIAANLQGIWNNHVRPPWSSNFTTNINTEMNYWMVESANLSELHQPLLELIRQLSITGKETAKNFYNASGWTLHHNTDIWATSNPVSGSPMWANWPMGGAWLSQHLWEHYQFTGDKKFLAEVAYPIMKESARFCIDWLVENKDGQLITAPATSPENVFITNKGYKGTVSVATTMDMSLIWDLFSNVIHASAHLGMDAEFGDTLRDKRSRLYPLKIGKKGNLQEWFQDWDDADPEHRHISHLFGLFPGRQISPLHTPEFADAARKSLELRGDGGTGWSKGWKINVWARLHDGNHAYKLIREQLKLTGVEGTNYANGGGTYPNLLDAHPPFQIDGNFGATSGITEMLLQSHDETLQLLPALPDAWPNGMVTGLKARGGFTIDITWRNKKVSEVRVHSAVGNKLRITTTSTLRGRGLDRAKGKNENPHYQSVFEQRTPAATSGGVGLISYDLKTEAGKTYVLKGM